MVEVSLSTSRTQIEPSSRVELPVPLLFPLFSLGLSSCESDLLKSSRSISTLPTVYLRNGVPFHGLSSHIL